LQDENFVLRHDAPGKLAMANFGINSNLSQFHIVLGPVPFLDSKVGTSSLQRLCTHACNSLMLMAASMYCL
jgi:cyclophilin family peptidyl-prolyl cis-trans isomerase